jgi:hypothetical protein
LARPNRVSPGCTSIVSPLDGSARLLVAPLGQRRPLRTRSGARIAVRSGGARVGHRCQLGAWSTTAGCGRPGTDRAAAGIRARHPRSSLRHAAVVVSGTTLRSRSDQARRHEPVWVLLLSLRLKAGKSKRVTSALQPPSMASAAAKNPLRHMARRHRSCDYAVTLVIGHTSYSHESLTVKWLRPVNEPGSRSYLGPAQGTLASLFPPA